MTGKRRALSTVGGAGRLREAGTQMLPESPPPPPAVRVGSGPILPEAPSGALLVCTLWRGRVARLQLGGLSAPPPSARHTLNRFPAPGAHGPYSCSPGRLLRQTPAAGLGNRCAPGSFHKLAQGPREAGIAARPCGKPGTRVKACDREMLRLEQWTAARRRLPWGRGRS